MTLLCRTAENLYWAGRYLERAEALARIVREHTALIVDLPTTVPLGWDPLLAIPGEVEDFRERYDRSDELAVMTYLLADAENPSSMVSSLQAARENLRTTRAVLPRGTWRILNEVVTYATQGIDSGVRRGGRNSYCERVIAGCQRLFGFLAGGMCRDATWDFYQLGVQIERADMTSRVLDVRAGGLVEVHDDAASAIYRDSQWLSLLRSLDGLQMYRRTTGAMIEPARIVSFVLDDPHFPRSIRFCLDEIDQALKGLPPAGSTLEASQNVRLLLARAGETSWTGDALHQVADVVQGALIAVDAALGDAYFHTHLAPLTPTSTPAAPEAPAPARAAAVGVAVTASA